MAPSSTKGAVTRLLRNAAINVTVFQFPCSTFWTSRSPCGARPYRRVIVVDTLVSSMNTSLLGSSLFCRRCNALRAAATSGRSCSAARKLFFKGQLQMMQKPRDRRLSDRDLFLRQSIFEFGQRDVRLLRYQLPHQILVRRQREIFIAAEFGRVDAARLPVKLEEADDRADADPALLRGFRDRGPALDRLDHTPTQIRRIWLRHSCRPPPSRKLESYSRRYGNPRFSLSGKRSRYTFGRPIFSVCAAHVYDGKRWVDLSGLLGDFPAVDLAPQTDVGYERAVFDQATFKQGYRFLTRSVSGARWP